MEFCRACCIILVICMYMVSSTLSTEQRAINIEAEDNVPETLESPRKVRQAQQDINSSPFIFESTSLPMLGNSIDYRYMPFVGNGHLATTVYSDTVYVNGVYNGRLGNSHRARIPSFNAISVDFQDNADRRDATRSYQLKVQAGQWVANLSHPEVTVLVSIYAHQFYHNLLITRVVATRSAEVDSSREFVWKVTNNRGQDSEDIDFSSAERCSGVNVPDVGMLSCNYISGNIKQTETSDSKRTAVFVYFTPIPNTLTLAALESTRTWLFVTAIGTDENKVRSAYEKLQGMELNKMEVSHLMAWQKSWDSGRIELEGDIALKKVLYASQYYIKSSLPALETDQDLDEFYGVSPGGLGRGGEGADYQGHVFWDMETWIYPTMLLLQPSAAKAMLKYRVDRMEPARKRAKISGHDGLRYPWESAFTGEEVTPDICVACRDNEQHVTADIAFAARQYVAATRDMDWLTNEQGCEFIIDMAKFWVSRAEYDPEMDRYHIRGVMPPDEYHTNVDDSVFTNVGASLSIHMANYTACLCREQFSEDWHDVASKLLVVYDEERQYHPEYDGYNPDDTSANTDFSNITNNVVKQADVILIGYPFMFDYTDRETRRNDLNIYREVTDTSGPAMTWAMFSIGYREIGDEEQQGDTFDECYKPYVREPFKVWTEAREGIGATNFLTGMGGFLQTIMFGYGGFRLVLESLYFNATLPPGTTKMSIWDLDYLGNRLNFVFTRNEMRITVIEANSKMPLQLELLNDENVVMLGLRSDEYRYDQQAARLFTSSPSGCPLPSDSIIPQTSGATHFQRTHWQLFIILMTLLFVWYAVHGR